MPYCPGFYVNNNNTYIYNHCCFFEFVTVFAIKIPTSVC